MKPIFKKLIILCVFCFVLVYFCACVNPTIEKSKLSSPKNIMYEGGGLITWDKNENAAGYTLLINEVKYYTKENFYLFDAKPSVKYVVFVKCDGDGEYYSDSDFSQGIEFFA